MTRSKRVRRDVGKLSKSSTLGIAGLLLLLGSGLAWAGPPNPTASDNAGNTAGGSSALINNMGSRNSAFGADALNSNTTGDGNSAFGTAALANNNGYFNSAFGVDALRFNTTGAGNSAFGLWALMHNGAHDNSAFGSYALSSNTTGRDNSAFGHAALWFNTTGAFNSPRRTISLKRSPIFARSP